MGKKFNMMDASTCQIQDKVFVQFLYLQHNSLFEQFYGAETTSLLIF